MKNLVVELMGLPKAGRSTLMRGLHRILGSAGIPVRCFPEEARRAPFSQWQTDAFDFLASSVSETVSNVIEAEQNAEGVVMIERGIFDHMASALALKESGLISERPAKRIIEFLAPHTDKEDLILFLKIAVKTSLARDQNGDSTMPPGRVANPEFLKHLQNAYQRVLEKISSCKLCVIDAKKEISKVRETALRVIAQNLQEGNGLDAETLEKITTLIESPEQKGGKDCKVEPLRLKKLTLGYQSKGRA